MDVDERVVLRRLQVDHEYKPHWTSFKSFDGASRMELEPFENTYATLDAFKAALAESCASVLNPEGYNVSDGFRREIEVIAQRHEEGA